jgi:hypothetical protein
VPVLSELALPHGPGVAKVDPAHLHLGAVALAKPQVHIHRFGSSLNTHVHFHVCVVNGVLEALPDAEPVTFDPAQSDEAPDRAGLERLLRYCAQPAFAVDQIKQRGADLVYRCAKKLPSLRGKSLKPRGA